MVSSCFWSCCVHLLDKIISRKYIKHIDMVGKKRYNNKNITKSIGIKGGVP